MTDDAGEATTMSNGRDNNTAMAAAADMSAQKAYERQRSAEIWAAHTNGVPHAEIAKEHRVKETDVHRIVLCRERIEVKKLYDHGIFRDLKDARARKVLFENGIIEAWQVRDLTEEMVKKTKYTGWNTWIILSRWKASHDEAVRKAWARHNAKLGAEPAAPQLKLPQPAPASPPLRRPAAPPAVRQAVPWDYRPEPPAPVPAPTQAAKMHARFCPQCGHKLVQD